MSQILTIKQFYQTADIVKMSDRSKISKFKQEVLHSRKCLTCIQGCSSCVKIKEYSSLFKNKFHPVQGPGAAQGRGLLE